MVPAGTRPGDCAARRRPGPVRPAPCRWPVDADDRRGALNRRSATTRGHDALGPIRPLRTKASVQRRLGAVARLRTATATSAGGIVVRLQDGAPELVVGMRRRERDIVTWTLPKGTPQPGETREATATREVGEETGLEVAITGPLDSIHYTFMQRGTRIHKTVHYFMMIPTGGDLARHDHEFERVRWVRFDEAHGLLTFETERLLVDKAAAVLRLAEQEMSSAPVDARPTPEATHP
jgi:8-oxo-dGTP pyrophosphatase MutT (NUDIX family)